MSHPLKPCQTKICEFCTKPFSRRRFNGRLEDYGRFQRRKFCGKSCANSRLEPTNRATFHLRARKFLGECCETCGTKQNIEVHHLDGNIRNNTAKNTQTLCHSCHMRWHLILRKYAKELSTYGRLLLPGESPDSKPSATPSSHKSPTKSSRQSRKSK